MNCNLKGLYLSKNISTSITLVNILELNPMDQYHYTYNSKIRCQSL